MVGKLVAVVSLLLFVVCGAGAETWRGLTIAPEYRCSPYNRKLDYFYSQAVEREIVRRLGAVYGPYTGTCFDTRRETDIEHMVAASEAHDSGLVRQGSGDAGTFRLGLAEPDLGGAARQPEPEGWQRRCGVVAGAQSVLVRGACCRGSACL